MQLCLPLTMLLMLVGLFGALIAWGMHVRRAGLEALAKIAAQHGLTLLDPQRAAGSFGIGWLDVILTTESRGSGKHRRTVSVTRYRIRHPSPLRMGLKVHAQTQFFGDIADALGLVNDIRVGRKDLDDGVRIGAVDATHAAAVLTGDEVTRALLTARNLGRFYVNDHEAFAQHDGWVKDAQGFDQYAGALLSVVDALAAARARHRANWEAELERVWGGLAASEGFAYAKEKSALTASAPSGTAEVSVEIAENRLVTTARLSVLRPLGYGIQLEKTGTMQALGKFLGAQDVTIGVPAIDEAYTIKASNEAGARAVLSGMGADLATIHEAFASLRVVDGGLEARADGILLDAAQLTRVLRSLLRIVDGLAGSQAESVGAFR